MKKITVAFFMMISLQLSAATLSFNVIYQIVEEYSITDTVSVLIRISYEDKLCGEGIEVTKIFAKGMKIIEKEGWREITAGVWENRLSMIVMGNRKNELQLTVARRTDKESVFGSRKFRMKVKND